MDKDAARETRRTLRRVQQHLTQGRLSQGAQSEQIGFMEVVHHPGSELAYLNYATPRRNTAWVSSGEIERGLDALRGYGRTPRVEYIEGLYPPRFARNLGELGLRVERDIPLMIYEANGYPLDRQKTPDGISIDPVSDQEGAGLWWYVWHNAYYDVITQTIDPVFVGQTMMRIASGVEIDLVMHRYRFPVGVARLSIDAANHSAHIAAMALMREVRQPHMVRLLQNHAMQAALDHGCTLIFTSGETDRDRQLCRDNGFIDRGSVVCYAEHIETDHAEEPTHEPVAQPLLTLR